jgi:hypothetical protein
MTTKGTPTMRQRRVRPVHVPRSCDRCRRRLTNAQIRDGMAVLSDGKITHTVGTCCLTLQELGDLVLKEVSMQAGLNVQDGLVYVRPKRLGQEEAS